MQSFRTTGSFAALLATLAVAAPAEARDADPMKEGLAAEKAGKWQDALDAFKRAVADKPSAQAEYHLALAEEKLGRYVEAFADFQTAEKDATAHKAHDVRAGAQKHAADVKKKIARITIDVDSKPGLVVTLDGNEVAADSIGRAIEVNPGSHTVTAAYGDGESVRRNVSLGEGGAESLVLEPNPANAHAKHHAVDRDEVVSSGGSTNTAAWVAVGIGVVGVAAGSVFALEAKHQRDELRAYCPSDQCPPEAQQTLDTGRKNANIATAAFVVGGVGLALGAVLFLDGSSGESKPASSGATVHPYVGLGSAGMLGSF